MLRGVPITGTIAQRYKLAVETQTEEEYEMVCQALHKRYGASLIDTLHHLPKSLSPHYAVYTNPQSQYLIFLGSDEDRDFAVNTLWAQRK